jgi:putative transposase
MLMLREHDVEVSRETVRRWLHRGNLVYRRPRPTLGPTDEEREAKLNKLRELLAGLPDDETAVFQDEVDINTNPKIGSMWMAKGDQAKVETPGNNEKRYISGSIHWRTGQVFYTEGRPKQGRDTALFLAHLDDLRGRLRRYRKIHVICDNASCHTSNEVAFSLWDHRERIDLHFLPSYSPECNPIERVWWNLHDQITRNHQCKSMEELLDLTFTWLSGRNPFKVEGRSVYQVAA